MPDCLNRCSRRWAPKPILLLLFLLGYQASFLSVLYAENSAPSLDRTQVWMIEQLFREGDYYRTLSEIYRIRFDYKDGVDLKLELLQLQSIYYLHDSEQVTSISKRLLKRSDVTEDLSTQCRIGTYLTASLIKLDKVDEASLAWDSYCFPFTHEPFPMADTLTSAVDPRKAKLYSAILPGSGFLLSNAYGKAALSFLLNAAFLAGIHHYVSENQYGFAGLLFFFELGWYFGGQNAAVEAAENYNRTHIRDVQTDWIKAKINSVHHGAPAK